MSHHLLSSFWDLSAAKSGLVAASIGAILSLALGIIANRSTHREHEEETSGGDPMRSSGQITSEQVRIEFMERLAELKNQGVLTDAEFLQEKQRLLGDN